jgi:hypothetical protein
MGEFFTSFAASWQYFLQRREPLEVFTDQFPESPGVLAGWYIAFDPALGPAMEDLQHALRPVAWLQPYPVAVQHIWLGSIAWGTSWPSEEVDGWLAHGREVLRGLQPFDVTYPRLNCFHNAVVAEVEDERAQLGELARRLGPGENPAAFLPHLAVALPTEAGDPQELRDALVPLRETSLGRQVVETIRLGLVPLSRHDVLQPWTVAGAVELAQARRSEHIRTERREA